MIRSPDDNDRTLDPFQQGNAQLSLLHSQIRQNLGVFFTGRQNLMARRTVIGDGLPIGTGMAAVVAAEAARRIIVPKIVRMGAPGHPHVRKDIPQVDR